MTNSNRDREKPLLPEIDLDQLTVTPVDEEGESQVAESGETLGQPLQQPPRRRRRLALPNRKVALAWACLLLPLTVLLWFSVSFDRNSWPTLVGDEAVYLMAAQSIAFDQDLRYTTEDLRRFEQEIGHQPDGLILQSPDDGVTLLYGKSWLYPLAIAPFVRFLSTEGYAVANALYLSLAAIVAAWSLGTILGFAAPIFVSVFVFGSISFAHVFWAHSDLFLMSLVAIGCALLLKNWLWRSRPQKVSLNLPGAARSRESRQTLAGFPAMVAFSAGCTCLVAVVLARPLYAPLLLIPIVASTRLRDLLAALALVATATVALIGINITLTGEWSTYAGQREAFYSYTGFPITSASAAENGAAATPNETWAKQSETGVENSWTGAALLPYPFEPFQFAWNTVYFFVGRHTGLFPYFLPFLLGILAFRSDRVNWVLLFCVASIVALFLFVRPFNYYGGGGALANRYFLPIYPLFWFLARRSLGLRWPILVLALASLSLYPKWQAPDSFWRTPTGAFSHVSHPVARHLPYESTQNQLKPANTEDFSYPTPNGQTLWIKPLSPRVRYEGSGPKLGLDSGSEIAEVLVATSDPQRAFRIEFQGSKPFTARFPRPSARHRMWWSFDVLYLYRFSVENRIDGEQEGNFTITPLPKR